MSNPQKVVVAMSGGVDSSVVAALLVDQGYEVIGMMMRLWSEPGRAEHNRCCTPDAMARARRVAAQLDIPFYAIDAQKEFHDVVVSYFIEGYASGVTPNPCLMCNRHIRWEFLLGHALAVGADYMATGHYVRLERTASQPIKLLEALDSHKDQSYVLSVLNQSQLRHALFPLGDYTKTQVRALARDYDLPVAETKESQDLCFLAGDDYASFLNRNVPSIKNPGLILNSEGEELGRHQGLAFYTLGQRKGLNISSPSPLYVLDKNIENNTLIVGGQNELSNIDLYTDEVNWVSGIAPVLSFSAHVKIRYTSQAFPALVAPQEDGGVRITFDSPIRAITPGQAAVIYAEQEVIGSGIILPNQFGFQTKESNLIALENIQ